MEPNSKVAVIINPASGSPEPVLYRLNESLVDFDWNISITREKGDGRKFCQAAIEEGAKLIVSYGGDGTLLEVIDGLAGSDIPLLILRGGTGNLIADELKLPEKLEDCLALLLDGKSEIQTIDLGRINNENYFILRCGCGLEVEALKETDEDAKSNVGKLAYVSGLLKALGNQDPIDFKLYVDGAENPIEISAVALTVANAGSLGVGEFQIARNITMTDGLLDLFTIEKTALASALELISENMHSKTTLPELDSDSILKRQKVKSVRIETDRPVFFQADGDIVGETPLDISIEPKVLNVICPIPD